MRYGFGYVNGTAQDKASEEYVFAHLFLVYIELSLILLEIILKFKY